MILVSRPLLLIVDREALRRASMLVKSVIFVNWIYISAFQESLWSSFPFSRINWEIHTKWSEME